MIMHYEIRAYYAKSDERTRPARMNRLAYRNAWTERDKPENRDYAWYEFIDSVYPGGPDGGALLETPYHYGREFGEQEIQYLALRFSARDMFKHFGGRRDYIVCIMKVDTDKNGCTTDEDCIGRCDVTITTAGVMLHVVDVEGEYYEPTVD